MAKIFLFVLWIIFVSSGIGVFIEQKCKHSFFGFHAPIGFAALLFLLQLCYYPLQLLALDSKFLMLLSSFVLMALTLLSLKHMKRIIAPFQSWSSLWVLICFICFLTLFYHCSIGMEFTDSQVYINYITQNINIEHLGQFSFTNGQLFENPDIFYLYQGYYYFAAFMCWIINAPFNFLNMTGFVENITIISWGLGMIYSLISTMFIINVINYFSIKSKYLKYAILFFVTLFYNFYYWRISFAFYGNTFRTLLVGMLMFELYRLYQQNEKSSLLPFVALLGAGLATSSSFLFISFNIIYLLMAYLYYKKRKDTFKTLSILAFPLLLYTCAFISSISPIFSAVIVLASLIYYYLLFTKRLTNLLDWIDIFLGKYGCIVFLVLVPLFFVAHSFYIMWSNPGYGINFFNYFADHAMYDMTVDPYALYANPLEKILTFFKWLAVLTIIIKGRKQENNYLGFTFAFALIVFLNPLTITSISVLYTYNVYYRAFDILLNPFTVVYFIIVIHCTFSKFKITEPIIVTGLVASVLLSHLYLFTPISMFTSYKFHLDNGKTVDPITKIDKEELQVLQQIRQKDIVPDDYQITVISQLEGFKTFFPNTHQLFARAQYFNPATRVNDEFFEIAKRQYSWLERPVVDYTKACGYFEKYTVDLAIINFYESFEFDQATDTCMETVIKTENYHVKIPYN